MELHNPNEKKSVKVHGVGVGKATITCSIQGNDASEDTTERYGID